MNNKTIFKFQWIALDETEPKEKIIEFDTLSSFTLDNLRQKLRVFSNQKIQVNKVFKKLI